MSEEGETALGAEGGVSTGGCLCGGVRYRALGPLRPVLACHCAQCRRTSGNYVTATAVDKSRFAFLNEETLVWYVSSPGVRRGFCSRCGSNLVWDNAARPMISIFAGALDGPTGLTLTGHIFCADKGDYYEIGDGLPQHPRELPDAERLALAMRKP